MRSIKHIFLFLVMTLPLMLAAQWDEELTPHWDHDTLELKPGLHLFPTPARDYVIIEFEDSLDMVREISIQDLRGREKDCWVPSPTVEPGHRIIMYLGDLLDGTYLYRVTTMQTQYSGKFIINRNLSVPIL